MKLAKSIILLLIALMQLSCSSSFVIKPEWMGVHSQPWNCPQGYINVRIMKDKWQCQPNIWWGIEDRNPYYL